MAGNNKACHMCSLPTELLHYIFKFLSAKQLTKCREVCLRWKIIVDGLARSDNLWREYCINDFKNVYNIVRKRTRPGLLWYNIYKSLSLWPKLKFAREIKDEFSSASNANEEIIGFSILKDGIIAVHKKGAIVYYDIETLEQSKRCSIQGRYRNYMENDEAIVVLTFNLQLGIIRKHQNAQYITNVTIEKIRTFILVDKEVYYVNMDEEIYVCRLDADEMVNIFLKRMHEGIMFLGYTKKNLTMLTNKLNIYSLIGQDLILSCSLKPSSNLHQLREYNLLERLDWRTYFTWLYILNDTFPLPEGPLRDITVIRTYGDVVFLGTDWGVLLIYYSPYSLGDLDLRNAELIKQYNFMEPNDYLLLLMCPIIEIDVLETEDGHTVLVAMPKKIAVLDFVHCFKRTASVALLPYRDIQKVKILRIDDCT